MSIQNFKTISLTNSQLAEIITPPFEWNILILYDLQCIENFTNNG